jgi:hypothetical protein
MDWFPQCFHSNEISDLWLQDDDLYHIQPTLRNQNKNIIKSHENNKEKNKKKREREESGTGTCV